jgi:hypothetical protein
MSCQERVVQRVMLLPELITANASLPTGLAELSAKTRLPGQSHGAKEAVPRIGRQVCALELSFERVVSVGIVVGDNPAVTNEVDPIVDDVLKVRLLVKVGRRDPMDRIAERAHR